FTTTSEHGLAPEVHADAAPAPQHLPEPEPLHPTAAALAPEVQKQMPPGGMAMVPVAEDKKTLISETVSHVAASALATLAQQVEKVEATMHPATYLGNGQKTLEDMVMEQLRPMLRSWLDDNLPPMVERLVEREIQRISRRTAD
ncbi:MAG: DUF2497 domain-containing protein, partial [Alphaproteobacteria bacterium]|nr:DUF2497 domain-containing protein [Alphaproteobacteria bacterium]